MDDTIIKLISIFTTVLVGAITPGPNNFIVLTESTCGGLRAAVRPIAGVVIGSLGLLLIVWIGSGRIVAALPNMRLFIGLVGCGYLVWLALTMIVRSNEAVAAPRAVPTSTLSMVLFQTLNPKAWMLISAMIAAAIAQPADTISFPLLLVIFAAVMVGCLVIWALAGSLLSHWLDRSSTRQRFNQVMGSLLLISAPLLII